MKDLILISETLNMKLYRLEKRFQKGEGEKYPGIYGTLADQIIDVQNQIDLLWLFIESLNISSNDDYIVISSEGYTMFMDLVRNYFRKINQIDADSIEAEEDFEREQECYKDDEREDFDYSYYNNLKKSALEELTNDILNLSQSLVHQI